MWKDTHSSRTFQMAGLGKPYPQNFHYAARNVLILSGSYDVLEYYSLTIAQFFALNPEVGSDCQNLWTGYAYCTSTDDPADGNSPAPTTTSATVSSTTTSGTSTSTTAHVRYLDDLGTYKGESYSLEECSIPFHGSIGMIESRICNC
jgi:hypothetical protein